jgi:hypothetical protein
MECFFSFGYNPQPASASMGIMSMFLSYLLVYFVLLQQVKALPSLAGRMMGSRANFCDCKKFDNPYFFPVVSSILSQFYNAFSIQRLILCGHRKSAKSVKSLSFLYPRLCTQLQNLKIDHHEHFFSHMHVIVYPRYMYEQRIPVKNPSCIVFAHVPSPTLILLCHITSIRERIPCPSCLHSEHMCDVYVH